jgi:dsRNA-specific ribonuclease
LAVAGDVYATGTIVTLSDARAKVDLEPIGDALAKVLTLSGYTFLMRAGASTGSRRHTGLIAQDVEAVIPEAVYAAPDTGLKTVAYGNLAGLLVEAIKDIYSILERIPKGRDAIRLASSI